MGAHELAFVGLAGSSVGTALSVPMVWPRAARSLDVRLLGSAVLLMSAIAALISARLAGLAPETTALEHAINILGLFAFPILLMYTRLAVAVPVTVRTAAWCWLPVAIYVAYIVCRVALGASSRVPFAWILPVALGFTAASIATLCLRRTPRASAIVPAEWVVAFVVMVNTAQVARMEFGHIAVIRAVVPLALSIGFIAMAAFAVWRTVATAATVAPVPLSAPRYERSGLEASAARDLFARIEHALTHDRVFVRADLTLGGLAAAVAASPHQVSEVLNRYAGVSFHDLINRRRLEEVKTQLLDPANERFTIEGIGAAAGFGSRSALYATFRKFEGTTPTAFRAASPLDSPDPAPARGRQQLK